MHRFVMETASSQRLKEEKRRNGERGEESVDAPRMNRRSIAWKTKSRDLMAMVEEEHKKASDQNKMGM